MRQGEHVTATIRSGRGGGAGARAPSRGMAVGWAWRTSTKPMALSSLSEYTSFIPSPATSMVSATVSVSTSQFGSSCEQTRNVEMRLKFLAGGGLGGARL